MDLSSWSHNHEVIILEVLWQTSPSLSSVSGLPETGAAPGTAPLLTPGRLGRKQYLTITMRKKRPLFFTNMLSVQNLQPKFVHNS